MRSGRIRKASRIRKFIFPVIIFLIISFGIYFFSDAKWDGNSRFTVVIQNTSPDNSAPDYKLAVFSIEPSEQNAAYIYIRPDFQLDIPYGYQSYPVYSIYKLGQLDHERGGGILLKKSIELSFGIKTDRYILFNSKKAPQIPTDAASYEEFRKKNLSLFRLAPLLRLLFDSKTKSDMTGIEKIRFFIAFRKILPADTDFVNLSRSTASIPTQLADKTNVLFLDQSVFDSLYSPLFADIRVRTQVNSIEVQNSTGKEKIASQFSRILTTLGGRVVLKTTGDNLYKEGCTLMFFNSNSKNSFIANILRNDFKCKDALNNSGPSQTDIRVIIGEEFLK